MSFRAVRGRGARDRRLPHGFWVCMLGIVFLTPGCATLREVLALRQVEFSIDQVRAVRLAGVDLHAVRSYEELRPADAARIAAAVLQKKLPLQFDLHVRAENPRDNEVTARLLRMEWMLLLQDRETIRGTLERTIVLPPGEPQDIPITMSLDLLDFFSSGSRQLVDLALAVAGQNGSRASIALRATPSVDTPLGPLRYPEPITILQHEFGKSARL